MQREDLLAQIETIKWFHRYDRETFGFETKGGKGCRNIDEVRRWGFSPYIFENKTVLDIGAWDGYNSFYAEKLGAEKVLAIDHPAWSGDGWGTKDGFNLAHKLINSRVGSLDIDLHDISPDNIGTFDVVLFLGVLYHLKDPLKGLEKAAAVTNKLLILETTCEYLDESDPLFIFRPERFNDDPRSYYSPNLSRIKELFADYGFNNVKVNSPHNNRVICFAEK